MLKSKRYEKHAKKRNVETNAANLNVDGENMEPATQKENA